MPHSVSAKKRLRQNEKLRAYNRWRKRQMRGSIKDFELAVKDGDVAKAEEQYRLLTKSVDKVAGKGVIHKKNAARRKSRLAKRLNALKAEKAAA